MRSKYYAKPCWIDGIRFASQMEGRRYQQLKILEQSGQIQQLRLQVRFPLRLTGVLICTYVADFVYIENDTLVVDDCKGKHIQPYPIKKKLMKAIYGIDIRESAV